MLQRIKTFFKEFNQRRVYRKYAVSTNRCANLALKQYKVALIDLYNTSGENKRKLILLKIKAGNIWSKNHYKKFLSRALDMHSDLTFDESRQYFSETKLKQDFVVWCRQYFPR